MRDFTYIREAVHESDLSDLVVAQVQLDQVDHGVGTSDDRWLCDLIVAQVKSLQLLEVFEVLYALDLVSAEGERLEHHEVQILNFVDLVAA